MTQFVGSSLALTTAGFAAALAEIGAAEPSLWAVLSTETSGCGFQANRKPKVLFERHWFHHFTGGRYDAHDPDISAPTQGGYGAPGENQYLRLRAAMQLDEEAALQSASWGLGQIMGFNFKAAGFSDVRTMVASFVESEDAQLTAMAAFLKGAKGDALQSKAWDTFARLYNGPNYAANNYSGHLSNFCGIYESQGTPSVTLRAAQMYLTFLNYDVGGIDGIDGKLTNAALQQFCLDQHTTIPPTPSDNLLSLMRGLLK